MSQEKDMEPLAEQFHEAKLLRSLDFEIANFTGSNSLKSYTISMKIYDDPTRRVWNVEIYKFVLDKR
ncbi:GSCOCT00014272001.2-RA-CDS [Cotesia congregata]|uniref:Cc_single_35.3 n=1 Tax=Cotesia congregata TaxID=51543 RepID=S6D4U1_COTCN|nr:GSCOCT00014272001.2-RA-CDS [Cotesia congregata]CAG5092545.1 cc_single_35.3 [Cotesia congregata]CCQ71265.1 hypothetical protein CcBV_35.3 [Cotesia congregata]